MDLKKILLVEI